MNNDYSSKWRKITREPVLVSMSQNDLEKELTKEVKKAGDVQNYTRYFNIMLTVRTCRRSSWH